MATTTRRRKTLAQEALALRKLKREEAKLKERYEDVKSEREESERRLMERMELEETESIRADGTLFVPTSTTYGQVQDPEAFFTWARTHDSELVETKPRKGLVNELVREKLDNNEELPPGVGFYVKEYVSQRSA